jgi:serine/threonine-protein phosphatase 2A regulatory subunit A
MDIKRNEDVLVQLIKRLNESSYYLSKGAVAMLIPAIYRKLTSTNQSELYQMYTKLVLDAKPSVRKFASQNFKDYVALHPTISEENIRTAFENLLKDDQDFVRLYVVDALVALTLTDIASKNQSFFTSVVGRLANDASWRIKYYLCEKIDGVKRKEEAINYISLPFFLK